jgi:hypothetical protein
VADIETLISRHLDGELTPAERAYFRRLLAESSDARALLREMTEVARAARRMPRMHAPAAPLEASLFQRLEAEGLNQRPAQSPAQAPAAAPRASFGARGMVTAGLLLLLLLIGGGYLGFNATSAAHAPVAAGFAGIPTSASFGSIARPVASIVADRGGMVNIPSLQLSFAKQNAIRGISSHRASHGSVSDNVASRDAARPMNNGAPVPVIADSLASARYLAAAQVPAMHEELPPIAAAPLIPMAQAIAGVRPSHHWIASFRGGIAAVNDQERTMVRELDMKVGLEMEGGHKVSFIVGMAPTISETHRDNTGIAMTAPVFSQVPTDPGIRSEDRETSASVVEYERTVSSEPWFGVGYNYTVAVAKDVSIDPGMKAGASVSTWRVGAELPVSMRMSKNMSVECAFSVSRVLPRHGAGTMALTDTPDHFIYEESKQAASFTTYGVQLGIRLELQPE